jgi:flagellar hook-length control protein FliK
VAAQLGRQLAVLRNAPDGSQTMTVVITPESLGTVTVAVTVTDGKLDLRLHGAHEAGRHALTEALPELRRDLESAGLTFDRLSVDASSRDGGTSPRTQQQVLDARTGQQGSSGQPGQQQPRAWGTPDQRGEGSTPLTSESASSGVDVRV